MSRKQRPASVTQSGTITNVRDCGTVVLVIVRTKDELMSPVAFDHRSFRHLLEAEGCTAADLMGRKVKTDGLSMVMLDG